METRHPKSLEEAIDILMESNAGKINELRAEAGEDIITRNHLFGAGMAMRNDWKLWFNKPGDTLTEWFTSHDINHGDDRSGAIMEAFVARVNGKEFDLEKYKARLKKHWLQYGPKEWNGIVPVPSSGAEYD